MTISGWFCLSVALLNDFRWRTASRPTAAGQSALRRAVAAQQWFAQTLAAGLWSMPAVEAERLLPWAIACGHGDEWARLVDAAHRQAGTRPAWVRVPPGCDSPLEVFVSTMRAAGQSD